MNYSNLYVQITGWNKSRPTHVNEIEHRVYTVNAWIRNLSFIFPDEFEAAFILDFKNSQYSLLRFCALLGFNVFADRRHLSATHV